jgi:uncharacterized membrane protein
MTHDGLESIVVCCCILNISNNKPHSHYSWTIGDSNMISLYSSTSLLGLDRSLLPAG